MNIPIQIDTTSIARATNAAHYEYLDTVRKRTGEIRLENELWQRAVEEFRTAFEKEDTAFKQYRASLKTSPLKEADAERDTLNQKRLPSIRMAAVFCISSAAVGEMIPLLVLGIKITGSRDEEF